MDVDGDEEAEGRGDGAGPGDAASAPLLDYGRLKRHHRATEAPAERDRLDAEFKGGIEDLRTTLARLAPNLKVGGWVGAGGGGARVSSRG